MSEPKAPRPLPGSVKKSCDLFRLLAGHEVLGLAPGEIAKGLDMSASWVSNTLPSIEAETGFVERVAGTNRWRLGVPLVRLAMTVMTNLNAERQRLEETAKRYDVPL